MRVHGEAGAAGVGIGEENAIPGLAAIGGAKDTALLLVSGGAAQGADKDVVGVLRIHNDAANAACVVEAHMLPRFAGIDRFIDTVTGDIAIANGPGFAGTGPNSAGVGWRDG